MCVCILYLPAVYISTKGSSINDVMHKGEGGPHKFVMTYDDMVERGV